MNMIDSETPLFPIIKTEDVINDNTTSLSLRVAALEELVPNVGSHHHKWTSTLTPHQIFDLKEKLNTKYTTLVEENKPYTLTPQWVSNLFSSKIKTETELHQAAIKHSIAEAEQHKKNAEANSKTAENTLKLLLTTKTAIEARISEIEPLKQDILTQIAEKQEKINQYAEIIKENEPFLVGTYGQIHDLVVIVNAIDPTLLKIAYDFTNPKLDEIVLNQHHYVDDDVLWKAASALKDANPALFNDQLNKAVAHKQSIYLDNRQKTFAVHKQWFSEQNQALKTELLALEKQAKDSYEAYEEIKKLKHAHDYLTTHQILTQPAPKEIIETAKLIFEKRNAKLILEKEHQELLQEKANLEKIDSDIREQEKVLSDNQKLSQDSQSAIEFYDHLEHTQVEEGQLTQIRMINNTLETDSPSLGEFV